MNVIKSLLNVNQQEEEMFKNWDKDTDVDFKDSIISDIKRCSIVNKLGASSKRVQEQLLMLLVFYCVSTEIKFT